MAKCPECGRIWLINDHNGSIHDEKGRYYQEYFLYDIDDVLQEGYDKVPEFREHTEQEKWLDVNSKRHIIITNCNCGMPIIAYIVDEKGALTVDLFDFRKKGKKYIKENKDGTVTISPPEMLKPIDWELPENIYKGKE